MSTSQTSKPAKTVARKAKTEETAPAVSVPAPAPASASAPASSSAPKKAKKSQDASASASASAPSSASAPVSASASASAPAPAESVSAVPDASATQVPATVEQIATALRGDFQSLRENVSSALKSLDQLLKAHRHEVRDAKGRGRRKNAQDASGVKRKTIFTTPVKLRDPLARLLEKPLGSEMTPAEVTHHVNEYMKAHSLKTTFEKEDGKKEPRFRADQKLAQTLGLTAGEEYASKTLQKLLYTQYDMPPKASASAGAGSA